MNFSDLSRLGSILTPTLTPTLARAWTVGQVLQAAVVAKIDTNLFRLSINNQTVEARSDLKLAVGQTLSVEVGKNQNDIVLRVLTPKDPVAQTLNQAWREVLPKQTPLKPLVQTLTQLSAPAPPTPNATAALPAPVAALVKEMAQHIATFATLTQTPQLKQALSDSGVFLEPKLAHAAAEGRPPEVARDFKANLLKLSSEITNARQASAATTAKPASVPIPNEAATATQTKLLEQVEGALARTETHQLRTVEAAQKSPAIFYSGEIPIRDQDNAGTLELRIEEDNAGDDSPSARSFSVWFNLDWPTLGKVQARVRLVDDQVSVGFWTEHASTADLFRQHLAVLETGLTREGLGTGWLHSEHGLQADAAAPNLPKNILDEHV